MRECVGVALLSLSTASGLGAQTIAPESVAGGGPTVTRLQGQARFRGTEARVEWLFSSSGPFRRTLTGQLGEVTVFDGERLWRSENGGPAFELECFARERTLLEAAVWSGSWRRGPFEIRSLDTEESVTMHELRHREGQLRAELLTRGEQQDPWKLSIPAGGSQHRFEFESWGADAGSRWPERVLEVSAEGLQQSYEIHSALVLETPPAGAWTPPPTHSPARFAPDEPATIELRQVRSGHLFVRATVNGQDAGWFLFDSGAGATMLNPELSERLGLEAFGEERLTPFGPEAFEARLRRVASLTVGPLELRDLVVLDKVGPDMASRLLGEPVAGVLGWDVFLRSVVTIDARAPSIEIADPGSFQLEGADWQPLSLHWKVPYVKLRFHGEREGLFCLDTGAGNAGVIFHAAAVERLDLLEGIETVEREAGGPGGDVAMRSGQLDWIEFAGTRRRNVPALFSVGDDGEDDPYTLGFVGAGILGPVSVVYDYGRRRVAFVPQGPK